jgi:hypothetical protein
MEVSGKIHATAASLAVNKPRYAWNIRFSIPQSLPECSSLSGIQPRLLGRTARSQPSIPNRLNKRKLVSLKSSALCSLFSTWVIWSPVHHLLGTTAGTVSGSHTPCHIGLWPLLGTNNDRRRLGKYLYNTFCDVVMERWGKELNIRGHWVVSVVTDQEDGAVILRRHLC